MENILNYISEDILIILVSMVPVIELRGAIPFGIALGVSPFWCLILSLLGSTIPIPIILLGTRPIFSKLKRIPRVRKIINKITKRAMKKSGNIIKYGFFGLIIFVGIPLPGTGVWTGSLIAALINMRIKIAFPAIFIGNVLAGTIIFLLSYTTVNIIGLI